jgi:hypothetical protein
MFRTSIAVAAFLAAVPSLAHAQSASAPLVVTATVVSSCRVNAPRSAELSGLSTLPVATSCARRGIAPRVQRPAEPRRSEIHEALVVINF